MCYEDLAAMDLVIPDFVLDKHGLTREQVEHAWRNAVQYTRTDMPDGRFVIAAMGQDGEGRWAEITAISKPYGLLVFHANTPLSNRALREFGLR